jgi:hypothetical protein
MPRRKRLRKTDEVLDAMDWLKIGLVELPPITEPLVRKLEEVYPDSIPTADFDVAPWVLFQRTQRVNRALRDAGLLYSIYCTEDRIKDYRTARIKMYLCR